MNQEGRSVLSPSGVWVVFRASKRTHALLLIYESLSCLPTFPPVALASVSAESRLPLLLEALSVLVVRQSTSHRSAGVLLEVRKGLRRELECKFGSSYDPIPPPVGVHDS